MEIQDIMTKEIMFVFETRPESLASGIVHLVVLITTRL